MSPRNVSALVRDGFLVLPGFLNSIHKLVDEFNQLVCSEESVIDHQASNNGTQVRALRTSLPRTYTALTDFLHDSRLLQILSLYFRSAPLEPHKQLEIEENRYLGGTNNSMWHFDRVPSLKCAIYLDDVDYENSPLEVVPRTHGAPAEWRSAS